MDLDALAEDGDRIARVRPASFELVVFDDKIPGDPFPAMRPRVTKNGTYTPARYREQLESLEWALTAGRKCKPVATPVRVRATFYRATRTRVDVDNLLKTVLDAATKVLWLDDSQVAEVHARKVLGIGHAHACTQLEVRAAA